MAGEWKTLPLQDCMAAIIDYRGKTPDKKTFGIPLVTAKVIKGGRIERPDEFIAEADFDAWMRRGMPESGDIVMTTEAPLGEIAQLDGKKVALAQRVITLRGKPDLLDNTFLKFLLQSHSVQEELQSRATGTTVLGIRQSELRKVNLTLPPFPEQKAIAHVLGTLDDLIELNRDTNEILEEMARALFKSWFVDFDPVRAKLEGRPPAGMDAATAALFPDHFQDSELGQIPKGWEVKTLSKNIELLSGGTPKTSEPSYWDGDIPWYSVRDAPSDEDVWVVDTEKRVTPSGIANSAAKILPEKTTIISARGTVGKLALIGRPMAMNQSCYGVRGAAGYGELFTYYCLKEAVEELQQNAHGSVFDTITRETFTSLQLASPPPGIAASFECIVEPLLETILANVCESRDLATLRDTLLPKLLSGEVSAPAAEELIAASK
jgi:type I restriction enzyme S subunit